MTFSSIHIWQKKGSKVTVFDTVSKLTVLNVFLNGFCGGLGWTEISKKYTTVPLAPEALGGGG